MVFSTAASLLIVTKNIALRLEIEATVEQLKVQPWVADSAEAAADLVHQHEPALGLLDIRVPGTMQLAGRLRGGARTRTLPLILLGDASVAEDTMEEAYRQGAADFLILPVSRVALQAKIKTFVDLHGRWSASDRRALDLEAQAATALAGQQERLRLFMDAASDYALFFADAHGVISEWPAAAVHLLGYSSAEAVGQPIDMIFTPEDRETGAPEHERQVATLRGQARDERWHQRKDGSRFFATGRLVALRRSDGSVHGYAKILRDATALLALRESEAKFREIFETANEGIWILNPDARVEMVNRRMAEMLGYEPDEMIGRRKAEFGFPEDLPYIERLFAERRAGASALVDVRFRHRDGHEVWTVMSGRALMRGGVFAGALDMFTDNSARRAAEHARRQSDEQFRVFFESSAAGHVSIDPKTRRFLQTNARFREITGYTEEELRRLTFTEITHPDDRTDDDAFCQQLYGGIAREVAREKRYRRKDGHYVWVEITATVVRDADGAPRTHISVVQDITVRKGAEQARRESEAHLRLAIEAAELGTFFFDQGRDDMEWSNSLRRMLGVSLSARASASRFFERVHPDDRGRVEQAWELALMPSHGHNLQSEFRVVRPDGSVHHLVAASRSLVQELQPGVQTVRVVGTVRDITATKEFEAELQRKVTERTLALEEKTAQLESFCYTVAHDLRSPLRAISGYAEFILHDFREALPAEGVRYVDRIRASAHRLDALIQDLLTYSRITQVDHVLDRIAVRPSIDWALHELAPQISATAARIDIDETLPAVRADRALLDQVMLNLISNALKFVATDVQPHVRVSAMTRVDMVRITVQDNGIGIAPAHHQRIFKVFERLREAAGIPGTGVGLAIVARAADRLGGRAGVESQPGRGSTFWIELPKAES